MFKTRITDMLGIEYPILQGGMHQLTTAEFIAAVSNAGGLGIHTSASFASGEELRAEIRKTKELTDKPFGVNINLFRSRPGRKGLPNDEYVDVLIEEGVRVVETSGVRTPDDLIGRFKESNVRVIHKCTQVKHARHAESIGVDAVVLVGFEQGGALGTTDVATSVLIPLAAKALNIPVIAAGGIFDACGFVAALASGAEGVMLGSRFMATHECPLHPNVKGFMGKTSEIDTLIVERSTGNPHRALRNKASETVLALEGRGAPIEEIIPIISGKQRSKVFEDGEVDAGLIYCGQAVGGINGVISVKEVIDGMIAGATAFHTRLGDMMGKVS